MQDYKFEVGDTFEVYFTTDDDPMWYSGKVVGRGLCSVVITFLDDDHELDYPLSDLLENDVLIKNYKTKQQNEIENMTPIQRTRLLQQMYGNNIPDEPFVDINVVKGCFKQIVDEVDEIQRDVIDMYYEGASQEVLTKNTRDVIVDVIEFLQQLAVLTGVDKYIEQDSFKIFENNKTKVIGTEELAMETVQMYRDKGEVVVAQYVEEFDHYVVKDETGKVKKPKGFVSVEL